MKLALAFAALTAVTAQDSRDALEFIACPIYRDTDSGRKSGCWLADDPASGLRYDVTAAPTKPDWNHAILVEGRAAPAAGDPCGGIVVEPARVSVLDAPCTRHMIGAEGYKGRRFALPTRNVRPLYQERKRPAKPYAEGRFSVPFDQGGSFIVYQLSDYYLDALINYALDVQPARIEIAGHADTRPRTVSGQRLVEDTGLAKVRANVIRTALILRGIPADRIRIVRELGGPLEPAAFDGLDAATARRADVRIVPLGS